MIQYFDGNRWTPHLQPTPPAEVAPPGWYAADDRPGSLRYYDGNAWTPHYRGEPLPAAPSRHRGKR